MSTLDTPGQERYFGRLLLPVKVYVILASVWLIYSAFEADSGHVVLTELSAYVLMVYAICIPFFTIAAVVQFIDRWRKSALVSISFALAASVILAVLWQLIASAVR